MIDVIFLLLVFFLTTSSFQVVENLLPSSVSHSAAASGHSVAPPPEPTQDQLDQVVIKLDLIGDVAVATMNGVALSEFRQLKDRLKTISMLQADVPVVIDPNGSVPAKDVVAAYDWARQAGLSRVYLATRN